MNKNDLIIIYYNITMSNQICDEINRLSNDKGSYFNWLPIDMINIITGYFCYDSRIHTDLNRFFSFGEYYIYHEAKYNYTTLPSSSELIKQTIELFGNDYILFLYWT